MACSDCEKCEHFKISAMDEELEICNAHHLYHHTHMLERCPWPSKRIEKKDKFNDLWACGATLVTSAQRLWSEESLRMALEKAGYK